MKDFGMIAGALVLAGAVVAGTLYYRSRKAQALGGAQPGVNQGPAQQLNAYNANVPRPPSGNYTPPGGSTAADVAAWIDVGGKAKDFLGGLFGSGKEVSAVGALSPADAQTRVFPRPVEPDLDFPT